jgi:dTDP-glucose 4,6-dehydratase
MLKRFPGASSGLIHLPVNLGNPNEMNLISLARTIISLSGSKSKIEYQALPIDDPKQRKPDISRAKKFLKWHPRVDLKIGLSKTIEWFRE